MPSNERSGYLPEDVAYPFQGLNSLDPPSMLPPSDSPFLSNMIVDDGRMKTRTGYAKLTSQPLHNPLPYAITAVNTGTKTFTISGDQTSVFSATDVITVRGSTGNDGTYTVVSATFSSPNTLIVVSETVPDATVDGNIHTTHASPVMATFEFDITAGTTTRAVVVTTTRTYFRDFTNSDWTDVTPRGVARTITAASTGSNYFQVAGDHVVEYAADKYIYVRGSAGNDGYYKIISSALVSTNTQITVANVPSAVAGGVVERDDEFTGDTSNIVDYVIGTEASGRYAIMTNGKDGVYWWDGSWPSFRKMPISDTLTGFNYCKTLSVFNSRLVLANLSGSSTEPLSVAWSAVGDFDDFALASDSGSLLLADAQGEIERLVPLSDRLVVYATKTIGTIIPAGSTFGFGYETLVRDINLLSPRSVVNLGPFHMYQTQENIFLFDGTPQVRPLANKVKTDISTTLSIEYAYKAHAFYDTPNELAFWFVPTGETTYRTYVMELNTFDPESSIKWAPYTFANQITSIGTFKRNDSIKWNTNLPGVDTWQDGVGPWNTPSARKNFPIRILGGQGYVYVYDDTVGEDAGTSIVSVYRGPQFTVPGYYKSYFGRWLQLYLELRGSGSLSVRTSSDEGLTYDLQQTLTLSPVWTRYEIDIDFTSRTLGLELEVTSGYFELKWYRIYVVSGGD